MILTIREATPNEAADLSTIAVKAKGHWGYSEQQLGSWSKEFLTVSPEYIKLNHVWVAVVDSRAVGFAAIKLEESDNAILDHLWVVPEYIGKGVGSRLFLHVVKSMEAMNCRAFVFTSDPHADNFYYKMGARKIGECYSVLQKRMLTEFKYLSLIGGHP